MKHEENFKKIIVMKIGYHASETLEEIITRKRQEEENYGKFFWGYGGTLCQPLNQVTPFVTESLLKGIKPFLLMSFTPSKYLFGAISRIASKYSTDGKIWQSLPKGVVVKGSKYAIVCKNLRQLDFLLELNNYVVATGKSKGKLLGEYLKFRVDKACASLITDSPKKERGKLYISYIAEISAPYCVFVK